MVEHFLLGDDGNARQHAVDRLCANCAGGEVLEVIVRVGDAGGQVFVPAVHLHDASFLQRALHEDVDVGTAGGELGGQLLVELILAIGLELDLDAGFGLEVSQQGGDSHLPGWLAPTMRSVVPA